MIKDEDFNKAQQLIEQSQNIILATHRKPDGDACGSAAALTAALRREGKSVLSVFLTEIPEWYQFVFDKPQKPVESLSQLDKSVKDTLGDRVDLIIVADTNSTRQLEHFSEYINNNSDIPVLIFDHHVSTDSLGDVELVDSESAATGIIVYEFFKHTGREITDDIANALFVAVSTDTGWFQFSNTDSEVFAVSAELSKFDINPSELYHQLYRNFTPQRFALMTRMQNNLNLYFDNQYAEQYLTVKDFSETGADYKDTENLIDQCQKIKTVRAVTLFVELPDGNVKCSLRCRTGVDVRAVAQKFGGGGHTMAAGVLLEYPLDKARELIKTEIEKQLQK